MSTSTELNLLAVPGIRLGVARAGIKKPERRDVVIMALDEGSKVAAVFTRNAFCAAPVTVARRHRKIAAPRYLLINTGNANAGTGEAGIDDALSCCRALSQLAGCAAEAVLPFSTGVIGEPLPVDKLCKALPDAWRALSPAGWSEAAMGILTTDLVPKGISRQLTIDGETVTLTGIAKGSGMIRPDMATMLAYIATDARVAPDVLQQCLEAAVNRSFNRITVDGDTSTNDACLLIATGRSTAPAITDMALRDGKAFAAALNEVCEHLAQAIVRDGEGATKLIRIQVEQGRDEQECAAVAFTIAHSPLVKTAFFASDPNWGRILAAVGRAGIHDLDVQAIEIYLGDVCIVRNGGRAENYREELGRAVMQKTDITIRVILNRGAAATQVWTCDFSYDYVRINAEYRT